MPDIEKVVKGLECCIKHDPDDKTRCDECPYEGACLNRLKANALALLKAQEPVDAIKREQDEQEDRERPPLPPIRHEDLCLVFLCPECGCDLRYYRCERCYRCGRRVKWK